MVEIRANIDRMDDLIVPLLIERSAYVAQAAQFKPTRADVVVPERIEEIVRRVRKMAEEIGGDPDLLERMYRSLIDLSIAHEDEKWLALNRS